MRRSLVSICTVLVLGCGTVLIGCSDKPQPEAPATDEANPRSDGSSAIGNPAVDAELAKLSEAERELVVAQKTCPVTDELLGSMGPPIKVTVDGKSLYICCAHCEEPLKEKFDEYFAKVGKKSKAEATN